MKYCKLVSDFNQDQIENVLFSNKSFESPNVVCRAWIQSFFSPCVLSYAVHRQSKKPFKDFTSFCPHGLHEQSLRDHFSWRSFFIPENNAFFFEQGNFIPRHYWFFSYHKICVLDFKT